MKHQSTTHKEMFFHVRCTPELWGYSGGTVFARQDPNSGIWGVSVAICSAADQFSHARGRTVARRKFFDPSRTSLYYYVKPTYADAMTLVADEIYLLMRRKTKG